MQIEEYDSIIDLQHFWNLGYQRSGEFSFSHTFLRPQVSKRVDIKLCIFRSFEGKEDPIYLRACFSSADRFAYLFEVKG